ncbi:unnamed protein product [Linum trigynum]|uniref:Uncharacterized protein n=1 Tax=Linum trigynum TaxID=586398 RepID=A0AAV2G9Z8_9ROSI
MLLNDPPIFPLSPLSMLLRVRSFLPSMVAVAVTATMNLPRRHHKHYPKVAFPFLTNSNLTFALSGTASLVATRISTIPPHLPDHSPFESHLIPTKRTERASSFPISVEWLLAFAASPLKLHQDPLATRVAAITAISTKFRSVSSSWFDEICFVSHHRPVLRR